MNNLILQRKPGESVILTVGNERVAVTFVEQRGSAAKLGFQASANVIIDRAEVHERKQLQRAAYRSGYDVDEVWREIMAGEPCTSENPLSVIAEARNTERAANLIGRDIGKPPCQVVDERTNPRD